MDEGGWTKDKKKISNIQFPMSNIEVIMVDGDIRALLGCGGEGVG